MDRKLLLNSYLGKILRGDEVEESVEEAVEIMGYFFSSADQVLIFKGRRRDSRYLEEALEEQDLKRVGNYSVKR